MSFAQRISSFVPPPSYMRMAATGVDISDSSLKYIKLQPNHRFGSHLEVSYWGDLDIPSGVVQRGVVNDISSLAKVLRELKDRTGVDMVRVSLPEERAYIFETEIKRGTPLAQIHSLLEFRLEENVPLSPREAVFDYHIINEACDSNTIRVSVTTYARETITNYYEACRQAEIKPLAFEVEAQAIARAGIVAGDERTFVIVDFGQTRTGIGVVHHGVLMYTSTIDIGGRDLSETMRRQLGDVPEAELTKLKNTAGLIKQTEEDTVYQALLPTMSTVVDEVRTRVEYWNSREKHRPERALEGIILCGGSVNMKGLPEYMTEMIGIPAYRADVWQNVFSTKQTVPDISRRYSFGYATAIGLALASYT